MERARKSDPEESEQTQVTQLGFFCVEEARIERASAKGRKDVSPSNLSMNFGFRLS